MTYVVQQKYPPIACCSMAESLEEARRQVQRWEETDRRDDDYLPNNYQIKCMETDEVFE